MNPYFYIFSTLVFTVYGQIILKWRLSQLGSLPEGLKEKVFFLTKALFDPYIFWFCVRIRCLALLDGSHDTF